MQLSDLTDYAKKKYLIPEEYKWERFPGYSLLREPETGKWAALLMRQWDGERGEMTERCDIRCGKEILHRIVAPFLTPAYRMKGPDWIGVTVNEKTDPRIVFRLFDRAVALRRSQRFTLVLKGGGKGNVPIPPPDRSRGVPDRILKMQELYREEDGSFSEKCRNFYVQGKFMEDYEDNAPWEGPESLFVPVYHDLTVKQLRGYFTWRTKIRQGKYEEAADSYGFIYIYELLCGIGSKDPADTIRKLREFREHFRAVHFQGFIEIEIQRMGMEYAVVKGLPPEEAAFWQPERERIRDRDLAVLRETEKHTDEEIFESLCQFTSLRIRRSPVLQGDSDRGKALFAGVWRRAVAQAAAAGEDFFRMCFGEEREDSFYPLASAVYWEETPHGDTTYILNSCRSYICRNRIWRVRHYGIPAESKKTDQLLHGADRIFRKALKTGHYLRTREEEKWAEKLAENVLSEEKRAAAKAAVRIDLSGLDRIRADAAVTREKLLTEEEKENPAAEKPVERRVKQPEVENVPEEVLSPAEREILRILLRGDSGKAFLREHHLMASVVTDHINEVFFDEIGDSVLECSGDEITVAEDYREDLVRLTGGNGNG